MRTIYLCCLMLSGCIRLTCLGDSNTDPHRNGPLVWCERLRAVWPHATIVNRGQGMSVVSDWGDWANPLTARVQLQKALEEDRPQVVILAFTTNDIWLLGQTPEQIVQAYRERCAEAEAAGAWCFPVLASPFMFDAAYREPELEAANAAVAEAFPDAIDFWTGMVESDFTDGLHMSDSGQEKRMRAVKRAILGQ